MNDTTLAQPMVATAHAASRTVSLSKSLRLETSSMPESLLRQSSDFDWHLDFRKQHKAKLHPGVGVGMARFILGQTDTCNYVPFLINRANVI